MEKATSNPNFIQMEHDVLKFWDDRKCFELLKEKNKNNDPFRFIDGPITANNPMGIHHAWGRTLKDVFIKYKAMNGCSCHYRNGFDTQGLWVEVEVEKELGFKDKKDIENYGMDNFTNKCVERIKKFSQVITDQSKRLGQWMDWDNSYYTHTDENITGIWQFLKKCHQNGWITQSYRPMPWCPRCGTSLSEHEMSGSYQDVEHKAVFFKLPIIEKGTKILVWTTTPWTLSSNVALAVNPTIDYCEVEVKSDEKLVIIAKESLGVLGDDKVKVHRIFKGAELIGLHYETCFHDFKAQENVEHKIVSWDIVDPKEGTGVVHIAPGCGAEDFELGKELGLASIMPVDDMGIFSEGFDWLTGKRTSEVTELILDKLDKQHKLYKSHMYRHSYPVCWRCKTEVIFRLVPAWYIKTEEIKPRLLEAASKVKWEPEYIGKRMNDWLTNMGDWNISRKRYYGLPLPFYRCDDCGELTVIGSREDLKEHGAVGVDELPELHRPWIDNIQINCPKCNKKVSRVPEIGDVWLDAGIVPFSTLGYFKDKKTWEKHFPAEWVTEMREQVRLWFYSLLFMSVTLEGRVPYEKVLAYNSVISEDGTKFSKTGFMIKFDEAAEKIGVDPIRYLFAGANVTSDVRFGFGLGDEARRKILAFWNIYVFFNTYASIDLPDMSTFVPVKESFTVTDKWIIARTNKFITDSKTFMEKYQSSLLVKEFEMYVDDVSNWYIRVNRRRFWKTDDIVDKNNAYWCLYNSIKATVQIMAPIIPFITEHIWSNMVIPLEKSSDISVHLSSYPKSIFSDEYKDLLDETEKARGVIGLALRLRNESQIKLRQPLSKMYVKADETYVKALQSFVHIVKDELNVKEIVYIEDNSVLDEPYISINFKKAGAVLKQEVQTVKTLLEQLTQEQMSTLVDEFNASSELNISGWSTKLSPDLFVLQNKPKKELVVGSEGSITIALDTKLNEELIIEGTARDIIRQCQVLRKEADFKVEDRIIVCFKTTDPLINKTIDIYAKHIKEEILAKEILDNVILPVMSKDIVIGDAKLEIVMGKFVE